MKFCISTSDSYIDVVLPTTLKSLINSGVKKEDIVVSINSNKLVNKVLDSINFFWYNSKLFEYITFKTSLKLDDDIFLLHDTCEVDQNFYNNVINFNYSNYCSIRVTPTNGYTSSNFGIYTNKYLKSISDRINSLNDLSKQDAISLENTFFGGNVGSFNSEVELRGVRKVYQNSDRLVEYYKLPGIFKYKANFGSNNSNGYFLNP